VVLTAGTYWFTLAGSDSDRNIVQVWDADRMHLITTILAIPDYRLQPHTRDLFLRFLPSSDSVLSTHVLVFLRH